MILSRKVGDTLRDGLVLDLSLSEKDSDTFMSDDVYGHLCTNHGSDWNMQGHTFNGIDDYVDCGNDSTLQLSDVMTITGWFKTNHNYSGDNGFICGDYDRTIVNGIGIMMKIDNKFYVSNWSSVNNYRHITSLSTVNDNLWHHFVVIFTGGTDLNLYIDNIDQGDSTIVGTVTTLNHGSNFLIGQQTNPAERRFKGSIDDVRIYNRVLLEDEILSLYESYRPKML